MSRYEVVSAWEQTVSRQLPVLSAPQARVLALWSVALALDATTLDATTLGATTLGARFTVLALCVVYRGGAVPVAWAVPGPAWAVVGATTPGAGRPHWERLLRRMQARVPADWQVVVLADRGLYAPWLFQAMTALGWHPGLRLNGGGAAASTGCPGGGRWRPLRGLLTQPGEARRGAVRSSVSASRRWQPRCWRSGNRATRKAGSGNTPA